MITGYCKNCQRELHNDIDYYGYCSSWCCSEFSMKKDITFQIAKDISSDQDEIERLEQKLSELDTEVDWQQRECSNYAKDLENANIEIDNLNNELVKAKNVDWKKVKQERYQEAKENEAIRRKMKKVEEENDRLKEENDKVRRESFLIHEQNIDLLQTIKNIRSYSKRFQLLDLGIEFKKDE